MHEILNKNLVHHENTSQALVQRLRRISPDPSLELLTAQSGDWTARKHFQNGSQHFLHSRIDPRIEAILWAESQYIILPHIVIIGIGLAYHVFEILKKCGNIESAYLIEADERIFQMAMRVHDFSSLFQNTSINFLIGFPFPDIVRFLETSLIQPFSYHVFLPAVSLYSDTYNSVRKLIDMHLWKLRTKEGADENTSIQNNSISFAKGVETLLYQMSAP